MAKPNYKKQVSTNPAAQVQPSAPAVAAAPAQKLVAGVAQKLVQVEYALDNHHILDIGGVHAVRKGLNHLPEHVWEKAKAHPTVAKLIEDGHLVEVKDEEKPAAKEEASE